jgi:hypothetical protein
VLWQEEDLRGTISVGRNAKAAASEPAASQGFGAFNSTTDTIEWRLDGKRKPFAIIQRWHIADADNPTRDGRPGTFQRLVVTRLPPGPVCHVAYIEVKGNPNPNEEARRIADETARGFDCKESPAVRRDEVVELMRRALSRSVLRRTFKEADYAELIVERVRVVRWLIRPACCRGVRRRRIGRATG